MLVKVNNYSKNIINVTQLDIDDDGNIISIVDLNLKLGNDPLLYESIKNSSYATIFLKEDVNVDQDNSSSDDIMQSNNIILNVIPMTLESLNEERKKIIDSIKQSKRTKYHNI